MRNKSTIAVSTVIACMSIIISSGGCIGTAHWDGWTGRQVIVTVLDSNTNEPIKNADIAFQPLHSPKNQSEKYIPKAKTGPDGVGKLYVFFGASGKKTLLGSQGRFGIHGNLEVAADKYSTLTKPLSSLSGKERIDIRNKSAIQVRVNFTRK
jgi:hypothetical protein